ncbi:hypothetical protein, partial [Bacillus mycoides]|uniref:hypothetical protein n=1 Tax=Bacillus mycoides TaxID=1405 RepID=UPI001C92FE24
THPPYTPQNFQKQIQNLFNPQLQLPNPSQFHQFQLIPKTSILHPSFPSLQKYTPFFKNLHTKLQTTKQILLLPFLPILIKA